MDFETPKKSIKGLNLVLGSASKSNFLQYFHCVIKGNFFDFEIENLFFEFY